MNKELITRNKCPLQFEKETHVPMHYNPIDREEAKKAISGIISVVKDDSLNTKRVIASNIASTERVQSQNDKIITACANELRNPSLSFEQREQLLERMERVAKSTSVVHDNSTDFQKKQLEYSHSLCLKILGLTTLLAVTELVKRVSTSKR